MMRFECDPNKSDSNAEMHGIDFKEAQWPWGDRWRIGYELGSRGESRFAVAGKLLDGHWTAICTTRGESVRIISVRRATMEGASTYDRIGDDG